jgi:hypothetical protein
VKNCGPQGHISSSEVLYLKVICKEECDGSDGEGFYKWIAKDLTTDRDLILDKDNTELGAEVDKLIIKEKVLTPGNVYRISVRGKFCLHQKHTQGSGNSFTQMVQNYFKVEILV